MGICCEAFVKHWILFPTVWHLPRLSQGRTQGKQNVVKNAHSLTKTVNKKDGYRQLNVRQLGSLRPWDHRGKCHMDRKKIQCLSTPRIMYPAIFNHFWDIARYWSRVTGFWQCFRERMSVFNHILLSPAWYAPGTIAVNVTWIEREFTAMVPGA